MLRLGIVACVFLLTGCAGSAYRLPTVNDADLRAMEKKMTENRAPLKMYERSNKSYKETLATINNRLVENAQPLCDYTEYTSCFFQTIYEDDDTINAYASEGYKITIHRGLLQYLKNNDEIAAVVAHEMGHHLARHNQEKQQNAVAGAAVTGILAAVLLGEANANNPYYTSYQQQQDSQTIENMMNMGAQVGLISYSKEQEREADLLAAYMLSRAGYNLQRAQNVLVVLSKLPGESDRTKSFMLDTHPTSVERLVAWEKAIDEVKSNPSKLPYAKESAEAGSQKTKAQ